MPRDRVVLGYDLRLIDYKTPYTIDPYIWLSLRVIDLKSYLNVFNIHDVWALSNGINLMTDRPNTIPNKCQLVAFDAPRSIVTYMAKSFGLTGSLEKNTEILLSQNFKFLGYDIVDLWTQTSAINQNTDLHNSCDKLFKNHVNRHGLIEGEELSYECCRLADKVLPYKPYQSIGIWLYDPRK